MKTKLLTLLSFLFSVCIYPSAFAQRTIPYPIIFVHGWAGSDQTWYAMGVHLQSNGLNVSLDYTNRRGGFGSVMNFHLNADGDNSRSFLSRFTGGPYYGDVYDYNSYINPNNDVFFVNFDMPFSNGSKSYSNESAAVKQGFAVGLAVKKVLQVTGAQKVILFGHSMGGLAIREYLQNSLNWPNGGHRVAKLITTGTPHGGSNATSGNISSFIGGDERSEAVRDLRYPLSKSDIGKGLYLYGGDERSILTEKLNFFNADVDCDGSIGAVGGLNSKDLFNDLDYSCIVGTEGNFFFNGDDVVDSDRANIFKLGYKNLKGDLFIAKQSNEESSSSAFYSLLDITWHTKLPKQRFINTYALDEPQETNLAFEVELGKTYKGFFTQRPDGSRLDVDLFKITIPQSGVLTLGFSSSTPSSTSVVLFDSKLNSISTFNGDGVITKKIESGGLYYLGFYGASGDGSSFWSFNRYSFSTSFCGLPNNLVVNPSNSTTFCAAQPITLNATAGYDEYRWFKDGVQITGNGSALSVNQSGTFSVQGLRCGVVSSSINNVVTNAKPSPAKPTIAKDDQPDKFVLTSSSSTNNQWILDGNAIPGATAQTFTPTQLGAYAVKVTQDDCSATSDVTTVKMDKPTLALVGSNPFCQGDSVKLVAPTGFGAYVFSDGSKTVTQTQNELFAKTPGNYTVVTQRGKFASVASEPIALKLNPKPPKPIISLEGYSLKSSSLSNNQWYKNGSILADSTGQYLRLTGSGSYTVQVSQNGCTSVSDSFVITGVEPGPSELSVKIYPNPSNGVFWVELPGGIEVWNVAILNTIGQPIPPKVISTDLSNNRKLIEVKAPSGMYLLKIVMDKGDYTLRFVID